MRNQNLKHAMQNIEETTGDTLLTKTEVAELFNCSTQTITRMEASGILPAARLGPGMVRFKRSVILEYIEAHSKSAVTV